MIDRARPAFSATQFNAALDAEIVDTHRHITELWPALTRKDLPDEPQRIPMPHPYVIPSAERFPYLFYWDSYFTIVGLAVDGQRHLILDTVENFLYQLRTFGVILNSSNPLHHPQNRIRSQPPYLTLMIREALKQGCDLDWLQQAFALAKREYQHVWVERRGTPVELSHYGVQGVSCNEKVAQFESGWDFSSRWDGRCRHLAAVDLNSNLYQYERDFARFARFLGDETEAAEWQSAATARRERLLHYCYDPEQGLFFDYDVERRERLTGRPSLATFHPLFVGMLTPEEAERLVQQLPRFEHAGGLACTEASYDIHSPPPRSEECSQPFTGPFQWDYPNGWAPLHWIVISGLKRYGYFEEAARIAVKWLKLCAGVYQRTGRMWEKYDVVRGSEGTVGHYPGQHGFGWTNGVFSALLGKVITEVDYELNDER